MSPYLSPRELRAVRAATAWAEDDAVRLHGVAVEVVTRACARQATHLGRDLSALEVVRVCAAAVDEHEQRQAQEAIASAREEDRLAYLARVRERILSTR